MPSAYIAFAKHHSKPNSSLHSNRVDTTYRGMTLFAVKPFGATRGPKVMQGTVTEHKRSPPPVGAWQRPSQLTQAAGHWGL